MPPKESSSRPQSPGAKLTATRTGRPRSLGLRSTSLVTQNTSQKVLWREGLHFRIHEDPAVPPRLINQLQTAARDDAEQPRPETARRLLTLRYAAVSGFGLPGRGAASSRSLHGRARRADPARAASRSRGRCRANGASAGCQPQPWMTFRTGQMVGWWISTPRSVRTGMNPSGPKAWRVS
jgi:hypothetical protein